MTVCRSCANLYLHSKQARGLAGLAAQDCRTSGNWVESVLKGLLSVRETALWQQDSLACVSDVTLCKPLKLCMGHYSLSGSKYELIIKLSKQGNE